MHFLPKDFIETAEGWVFAVVDGQLESGRVLCFLRYVPDGDVLRKLGTDAANDFLAAAAPQYLFSSPRLQAAMHSVPVEAISRRYEPRVRLAAIRGKFSPDAIETRAQKLMDVFEADGLSPEHFGITGSVLIGAQRPDSDLDLVIYRRDAFFRAREILRRAFGKGAIQDLGEREWRESYERRGCALSFEEYLWHERRKLNKGLIEATKFDLTLVDESLLLEPGPVEKIRPVRVVARVVDALHAFDCPALYRLDHAEVDEALSFTQTYAGQALEGEQVEIAGWLERTSTGRLRVVVGSSREAGGEFIRVIDAET